MQKTFRLNIDLSSLVLITPTFAFCKSTSPYFYIGIEFIVFTIIYFGFLALIYFRTKYILTNKTFHISEIFSTKEISISSITRIEKVNTILASATLSISKLKVYFGNDYVIISPNNADEFIELLKQK